MKIYMPPQDIWILHPDGEAGPAWRRCTLSIMAGPMSIPYLSLAIEELAGGADLVELARSAGFEACVDRLFEDIMRAALPDRIPGEPQRYIELGYNQSKDAPVMANRSGLTSWFPAELDAIIVSLSNHELMRIASAAQKIAARQAAHREGFGPRP